MRSTDKAAVADYSKVPSRNFFRCFLIGLLLILSAILAAFAATSAISFTLSLAVAAAHSETFAAEVSALVPWFAIAAYFVFIHIFTRLQISRFRWVDGAALVFKTLQGMIALFMIIVGVIVIIPSVLAGAGNQAAAGYLANLPPPMLAFPPPLLLIIAVVVGTILTLPMILALGDSPPDEDASQGPSEPQQPATPPRIDPSPETDPPSS